MGHSTDRILTTHSGRLPEPSVMHDVLAAREDADESRLAQSVTAGVVETIERQQQIGIDIMSDGEFFHGGLAELTIERFSGCERRPTREGEPAWLGALAPETTEPRFSSFYNDYLPKMGAMSDKGPLVGVPVMVAPERTVVSGPLHYVGTDSLARELELSKLGLAAAGIDHTQMFYPQLGVGWLSHFTFNEFYKSDEEFAFALAEGMRDAYKAVIDAGFTLQIDDPSLVSRFAMLNPALSFEEYRKLEQMWTAAVNHSISGLPEERIRYHICWGSFHHPHTHDVPFQEIVDLFLSVHAGAYSVEAASVNHEMDFRVWETTKLPDGKVLIPGVISHATSNEVEPPELVAHRLMTYARLVGKENLIAGTDCGPGNRCQDDVAWAKLDSLVRGAELASEALWG
jgi:5-methyltetrahydropteroyltriglutamate--homocysteine methyltransferase